MPPFSGRKLPVYASDALAIAVVVCFAVVPFPEEAFRTRGPMLVFALLPAATLPFRRRRPIPALGVTLVCTIILATTGVLSPSALVGTAIVSYSVTERTRRTVGLFCVGIAALLVFGVCGVSLDGNFLDPRSLQFVMFVVLAGALGDAARSRREFIAAVTGRAERAERNKEAEARRRVAEERVRIARELHDLVAHQIAVISLSAGVASSSLATKPAKAQDALTNIRTASRTVLTDIGVLMALLRSDDLGDLSPQPGLQQLENLLQRFKAIGMDVGLHREPGLAALSPAIDLVAFLALQEGLTNAHKHGAHNKATVDVRMLDGILILVVSNPVRQDPVPAVLEGHGLRGIRERVAAVRGSVETVLVEGQFRLLISVPAEQGPQQ